ncbi:hypothetical protein [Lacisediminimonas profundi]|uniref:hypothetical protein n=1 Tax=Lacisediminimonas profundi TaxID=2603856 RepID=UPI00124B52C1|nr:hypothetical protein [Lacisediminimonas profundi]
MTNNRYSPQRDAGAWAKRILAHSSKRRHAKDIVERGNRIRTKIRFLIACKVALLTAFFMIE